MVGLYARGGGGGDQRRASLFLEQDSMGIQVRAVCGGRVGQVGLKGRAGHDQGSMDITVRRGGMLTLAC